jgi:Domain of unknown function (DUF4157)
MNSPSRHETHSHSRLPAGRDAKSRIWRVPAVAGPPKAGAIQMKLAINAPNDQYEREADGVAEQVMRMPDHEVAGVSAVPMKVQRKCACASGGRLCPECAEEEEKIQAKEVPGQTPIVTREVQEQIDSLHGGGQPPPESARRFFEPRFGNDFSRVRVHANSPAAESANAVNARAYTVGRDIVFNSGWYASHTSEGQRLLAQELAHVLQKTRSPHRPRAGFGRIVPVAGRARGDSTEGGRDRRYTTSLTAELPERWSLIMSRRYSCWMRPGALSKSCKVGRRYSRNHDKKAFQRRLNESQIME